MADTDDTTVEEKKEMSSVNSTEDTEKKEGKVKDEEKVNDTEDAMNEKSEKDEAEDDEEESSEGEDEELPPGLLEQPLEVSGKREKKKVDRLSATMAPSQSTEKKKLEIEEGSGVKLGEIAFIEKQMNSTKASDLKSLHRLLFFRVGTQHEVKKNIRQFCGFTHSKESKEHERRMTQLNKMQVAELKTMCSILALEKSGSKKDLVDRIMEFLMEPVDKGIKVPQSKRAKNKAKAEAKEKKKAQKRKRTPKQTKKKDKNEDDEVDEDGISDDDDEEDNDDDKDMSEQEIEESEDEAPKKKRPKTEPKKKVSPKVNGKKEKSPKKKEPKKAAPKATKEEMSDLSDDSDDDEPIAKLIKPTPPTNSEIKDLVKKILDGADLESVTMKTVVKEVYSKYPTFDLSDRKDFIKTTVREVIS